MFEPIDITVGKNISRHRVQLGYTLSALAEAMKIPLEDLKEYEQGTRHADPEVLKRFAEQLGIPLGVFLQPAGGLNPEVEQLLEAFNAIASPKIRKCCVDLVERVSVVEAEEGR